MLVKDTEYFTTAETSQRFDLLRHLIENSEIIPLVRGPHGIGKSLLAARIRETAPENWVVCVLEASPTLSPEQLMSAVARCTGWTDLQGDSLQNLIRRFESLRGQGKLPVILVDEAHHLQPASLMSLLRLFERQQAGDPSASIVLFADERIDVLLSTPQLRIMSPQSIQVIDLQPLTREEATSFMHFLLQVEGLSADLELSSTKTAKLYRETHGIPGTLREAIVNAFGEKDQDKNLFYKKNLPMIYLVMVILVLSGGILWFQEPINRFFTSSAPQAERSSSLRQTGIESIQASAQLPDKTTDRHVPEVLSVPLENDEIRSTYEDLGGEESVQIEELSPTGQMIFLEESEGPADFVTITDEFLSAAIDISYDAEVEAESLLEPSLVDVHEPVAQQVLLPQQSEETDRLTSEISVDSGETRPLLEETVVQEKSENPLRDSEWVKSRPPKHYTLQLLGVESVESLKRFIEKNKLESEVFYLKTQRNGKPWYPLLWGEFPDKSSAIKAQKGLSPQVRRQGVWARSFSDLQSLYEN